MRYFGDQPIRSRVPCSKITHFPTLPERILNRLFKKKEIVNCDRDTYLHRWYVTRKGSFGLFIHKFVRGDEDRALHDHPWDFIVIPIWRGYIEHSDTPALPGWEQEKFGDNVPVARRVWPIIGTRFRRGTYKHRVELLKRVAAKGDTFVMFSKPDGYIMPIELPAWSIFIRFKEFRDWGFHLPEGWVQWNKFWQEKCE